MGNKMGQVGISLPRDEIVQMKTKALRRGVWYRVLTKVERACIDLVIRVVERVRSFVLQKILCSILKKLEDVMESQVLRVMREMGGSLALKLSRIAQGWGNDSAWRWVKDAGFSRYLAITYMNAP